MPASLDLQIREQVARYLAGEMDLEAFLTWFTAHTWNIEASDNQLAAELAAEIELRLAEYTNNDWTTEQLRAFLLPLVHKAPLGRQA